MKSRRLALVLLWLPAVLLGLVLIAEIGLRLAYTYAASRNETVPLLYERVYWATPPWVHQQSIVYQDPELGRWMTPNASRTYLNLFGPIGDLRDIGALIGDLTPTLPDWARERPAWKLATNSRGMRDDELSVAKPPGTFRIAMLGDSWIVGVNVDRDGTIPDQLERLLGEELPQGRFEVLNFGMIGADVETGVRLLPKVLDLDPDVVILAYAQNDEAGVRANMAANPLRSQTEDSLGAWLLDRLKGLEVSRLYTYWRSPERTSVEATLRRELTSTGGVPRNGPRRGCPNPALQQTRYRATMIALVAAIGQADAEPLLLYDNVPEFPSHCTLEVLREVSEEEKVPLVDASAILATAGDALEKRVERELALDSHPELAGGDQSSIVTVFRVDMSRVEDTTPPKIMGSEPELGAFRPNEVALFDDGTNGDQVANDRVWSRAFRFSRPAKLVYSFTNGADPGEWTGLESYRPRVFALGDGDGGATIYPPVARFGEHTLRSDPSHADAEGYFLIAAAVLEALRKSPALAAYLAALPADAGTPPDSGRPSTTIRQLDLARRPAPRLALRGSVRDDENVP